MQLFTNLRPMSSRVPYLVILWRIVSPLPGTYLAPAFAPESVSDIRLLFLIQENLVWYCMESISMKRQSEERSTTTTMGKKYIWKCQAEVPIRQWP
jgi:hypothetical protein